MVEHIARRVANGYRERDYTSLYPFESSEGIRAHYSRLAMDNYRLLVATNLERNRRRNRETPKRFLEMWCEIRAQGGDRLPAYDRGSYPLFYVRPQGGQRSLSEDVLCPACAFQAIADGEAKGLAVHVHHEGFSIDCDECSETIESAYGDTDAESETAETEVRV